MTDTVVKTTPADGKKRRVSHRGSKAKGSNFERELAGYFNECVFDGAVVARRALLSGGGRNDGGADLDGLPGLHVEAKRTERTNVLAALQQAEASLEKKMNGDIGVVVTRRNGMKTEDSVVALRLKDFVKLYQSHLNNKVKAA